MTSILRPRWLAAITYLAYSMAGFAFMFLSSTGLRELLGEWGFTVWNTMLIGGGIIALVGALGKRHYIELIGIPGVFTGLGVYALYIGSAVKDSDNPGVVVGLASICAGAALGVAGRAYEVFKQTSISSRVGRSIREDPQ